MARTLLLLGCLLGACGPDPDPPTDDTGTPAPPDCAEGEIADGDVCVPEACGTGTWGNIASDAATVFVDRTAAEGGDGSAGAPFTTIGAALAAVSTDASIAVAAGSYAEALDIDTTHAGLRLAGRCEELVELDGSVATGTTPAIEISVAASSAELSGITLRDAGYAGILIRSGQVTLRDVDIVGAAYGSVVALSANTFTPALVRMERCEVVGSGGAGLVSENPGTVLTVVDSVVRDTEYISSSGGGIGVSVIENARLVLERSELANNRAEGILLEDGGAAELRESTIRDTQPNSSGNFGFGVQVGPRCSLLVEDSELVGNTHAAITVGGDEDDIATVTVRRSLIRDTLSTGSGEWGGGIQVGAGGSLMLEDSELVGNRGFGVALLDGASATITGTEIHDTAPDGLGDGGDGLVLQSGASATVTGCTFADNATAGIDVMETGSSATISDTVVRGTRPDDHSLYGIGMVVALGGTLEASGVSIEDNWCTGVYTTGEGSSVTLRDSSITGTQRGEYYTVAVGLAASAGARLAATDVLVQDTEGPGLYATSSGTELRCEACEVSGSTFAGAVVVAGGHLVLDGTTLQGTAPSSNLGGGVGLYAEPLGLDPPSLELTDSTVSDNPIAGVWLGGPGAYLLSGSELHGGEGETRGSLERCGDAIFAQGGVTAWDGTQGLQLTGNTIADGRGAGLFLLESSASVQGNTWQDNLVDLVVQGDGCESAPSGLDAEPVGSSELCPTWDYSTCGDGFALYLELAQSDARGAMLAPIPGSSVITPSTPMAMSWAARAGSFTVQANTR